MKINFAFPLIILALVLAAALPSQAWEYPVIKEAGPVVILPEAMVQPDPGIVYKVVFDVIAWKDMKAGTVGGLDKMARLINVFAGAGTPPEKLKLALVMHGPATEAALNAGAFQKKHGFANTNLKLIKDLKAAGVELYVCGQGLAEHDIKDEDVNPDLKIALSALTVLPTYQLRGYAFLPF